MSRAEAIQAIADEMRMQRLALRLTQRQVAEGIGVSPSSVASWERGDTEMGTISHALLKKFLREQRAAQLEAKRARKATIPSPVEGAPAR